MSVSANQQSVQDHARQRSGALPRLLLWLIAIGLTGLVLLYQKYTGDMEPVRGQFRLADSVQSFELPRSYELPTKEAPPQMIPGVPISVKLNGEWGTVRGAVNWRNYPSDDPFVATPFTETRRRKIKPGEPAEEWLDLLAVLPPENAGQEIEYSLFVSSAGREVTLQNGDKPIVLRYLGSVPRELLHPHNVAVLLFLVVAMRAALSAIFEPANARRYAWIAFILGTIGVMTLRPFVQQYAIGTYWEFSFDGMGSDGWVVVMWAVWLLACLAAGRSLATLNLVARVLIVVAACVTANVELIPQGVSRLRIDAEQADAQNPVDPWEMPNPDPIEIQID